MWTQYNKGVRAYCGYDLPEGMQKNQKLAQPLLTPTTKETAHDRPVSAAEILREGLMTAADWQTASEAAMRLYQFGVEEAGQRGLILVDTKYEFGKDADGNVILIDEIHTPDSSRYWLAESYAARFAEQQEPENIDKEFLRLWFAEHCDPYHDAVLPEAPQELIVTLASRYIQLYEMITGNTFTFPKTQRKAEERIMRNVAAYLV
jgi:phosphoribosylaminoimidazole-succinocarboxamide synthase